MWPNAGLRRYKEAGEQIAGPVRRGRCRGVAVIYSVLIRTLKEGKTVEDFVNAWMPEKGFGIPTEVVIARGIENPQEVLTLGRSDLAVADIGAFLERVGPQESKRHDKIDAVIDKFVLRSFFEMEGRYDFTNAPQRLE